MSAECLPLQCVHSSSTLQISPPGLMIGPWISSEGWLTNIRRNSWQNWFTKGISSGFKIARMKASDNSKRRSTRIVRCGLRNTRLANGTGKLKLQLGVSIFHLLWAVCLLTQVIDVPQTKNTLLVHISHHLLLTLQTHQAVPNLHQNPRISVPLSPRDDLFGLQRCVIFFGSWLRTCVWPRNWSRRGRTYNVHFEIQPMVGSVEW